jgi:hypothetical protein
MLVKIEVYNDGERRRTTASPGVPEASARIFSLRAKR